MNKPDQNNLTLIAKTVHGLEEILAAEIRKWGGRDVQILKRAVGFTGDLGMIYKTNLCLRTALRILVPFHQFEVINENDLYEKVKQFDWSEIMDVDQTLAIDTVLSTDLFNHSQFISQKVKDAIVDQFRDKFGSRPNVDLNNPDIRINLHINGSLCSLALDSSGDSLHKRGYREKTNLAPMNEVLAAGLVLLTDWNPAFPLVDPMCGSGTLLIEAALIGAGIPPGYYRPDFGFRHWKRFLSYDDSLWNTIYDSVTARISDIPMKLEGGELSSNVLRKAKENIRHAQVQDWINVQQSDISDFIPPAGKGVAIVNPPYGERMHKEDIGNLYATIGDAFKKNFEGYDCWIISSNMEALKRVGLRHSARITVFNGPLECRFVKYEMYRGTKKTGKISE
jgi:putative N6-adenine-specific DNA methylase